MQRTSLVCQPVRCALRTGGGGRRARSRSLGSMSMASKMTSIVRFISAWSSQKSAGWPATGRSAACRGSAEASSTSRIALTACCSIHSRLASATAGPAHAGLLRRGQLADVRIPAAGRVTRCRNLRHARLVQCVADLHDGRPQTSWSCRGHPPTARRPAGHFATAAIARIGLRRHLGAWGVVDPIDDGPDGRTSGQHRGSPALTLVAVKSRWRRRGARQVALPARLEPAQHPEPQVPRRRWSYVQAPRSLRTPDRDDVSPEP